MIELADTQPEPASIVQVPLDQVAEAPFNPWHGREDVAELAESVRRHGILQPVLLRPLPTGMLELVHGHRRARAARAAGLSEIPAQIRTLSDAEALELQAIENVHRSDMHPVDEGELYRRLESDHGYKVTAIAEKVGKSRSWVYERMRLATLADEVKAAAYEGRVTASVAAVLASLPRAQQAKALEAVATSQHEDAIPVREARRIIEKVATADLRHATWALGAEFPAVRTQGYLKIGPCDGCMYRAPIPSDEDGPGRCLDVECFGVKRSRRLAEEKARYLSLGAHEATEEQAKKLAFASAAYAPGFEILKPAEYGEWQQRDFRPGLLPSDGDTEPEAEDVLGVEVYRGAVLYVTRDGTLLVLRETDEFRAWLREHGFLLPAEESRSGKELDDTEGDDELEDDTEDLHEEDPGSCADAFRTLRTALLDHLRTAPTDRPYWLGLVEILGAIIVEVIREGEDLVPLCQRYRPDLVPPADVEDAQEFPDYLAFLMGIAGDLRESELAGLVVDLAIQSSGPCTDIGPTMLRAARRFALQLPAEVAEYFDEAEESAS